jgi:hypothetical protein
MPAQAELAAESARSGQVEVVFVWRVVYSSHD